MLRHILRSAIALPVLGFGSTAGAAVAKPAFLNRTVTVERVVSKYEYEGVGHNSWGRAYADAELMTWMLAQRLRATATTNR